MLLPVPMTCGKHYFQYLCTIEADRTLICHKIAQQQSLAQLQLVTLVREPERL